MVFHYPDGLRRHGQPQHQLDEIAARGAQPAGAENARGAYDQRVQVGLGVQFAAELGDGIGAQRMGGVLLGVGAAGPAVEDVIGGEVDQPGIQLPAGQRHIAHGQGVHLESGQRLAFGHVHHVVSRRIDDHLRIHAG